MGTVTLLAPRLQSGPGPPERHSIQRATEPHALMGGEVRPDGTVTRDYTAAKAFTNGFP